MRPLELEPLKGVHRSEYERTRDKHIRENMWKAGHTARKVSQFSGLPFEDLRSVALEAMVKLYDKWDPSKANFSTWLNRSLTFQVLNYLRDHSRMIRIPRTYADCYMRIRKHIGSDPDMSDKELAKLTDIPISMVTETRAAYQTTFLEINEDTEMPVDSVDLNDDNLDRMLDDYQGVIDHLFCLPEIEIEFLSDTYIEKRANSTIFRKYPGVNSAEGIRKKTSELMAYILGESECPSEGT
jgi:DNA-directed RNA polymerase specialized sigma subunit